jgi:hypothetical protein
MSDQKKPAARKPQKAKWRLFLWRWHRRIGLITALFILLLSLTGIILNHVSEINWLHEPVKNHWVLNAYGIQVPKPIAYQVGEQYVTSLGGEYFYLNDQESGYCRGRLKGAVLDRGLIVVACSDELVLLNSNNEVIERIGSAYGLPSPIEVLGHCGESLCLRSERGEFLLNIDQLSWQLVGGEEEPLQVATPVSLPPEYGRSLIRQFLGESLSWERVVLDLHSGRLFGLGPWLMDIVALFLIVLAGSGVSMWYGARRRRRSAS